MGHYKPAIALKLYQYVREAQSDQMRRKLLSECSIEAVQCGSQQVRQGGSRVDKIDEKTIDDLVLLLVPHIGAPNQRTFWLFMTARGATRDFAFTACEVPRGDSKLVSLLGQLGAQDVPAW